MPVRVIIRTVCGHSLAHLLLRERISRLVVLPSVVLGTSALPPSVTFPKCKSSRSFISCLLRVWTKPNMRKSWRGLLQASYRTCTRNSTAGTRICAGRSRTGGSCASADAIPPPKLSTRRPTDLTEAMCDDIRSLIYRHFAAIVR